MNADRWIRKNFPNLQSSNYKIISPYSDNYNCIAWAASDTQYWWWPLRPPYAYWPADAPLSETLESFIVAFQTLGYEVCDNAILEKGYEKVAVYTDAVGSPKHMARQLSSGTWTSKLGEGWDIEHQTLQDLEGGLYGKATHFLKRIAAHDK